MTQAIEEMQAAEESVQAAIISLSGIIIERCVGWASLNTGQRKKLKEILIQLTDVRDEFDRVFAE